MLAVASPKNNGLAELLSDLNPNRDPCVKSFIMPLVMRENSNKAGFSAPTSPVVTDDLASAWLVRPEESGLRRKLAVVPEMGFYIPAAVRNRPGKRWLPTTKENTGLSHVASPDFRPNVNHELGIRRSVFLVVGRRLASFGKELFKWGGDA